MFFSPFPSSNKQQTPESTLQANDEKEKKLSLYSNATSISFVEGWFLRRENSREEIMEAFEFITTQAIEQLDPNWVPLLECIVTKNVMTLDINRAEAALALFSGSLSLEMQAVLQRQIDIVKQLQESAKTQKVLNLKGKDLSQLNLWGAYLVKADLRGANLSNTGFRYANLTEADLSEAILQITNFTEAILIRANLTEAKLFGVFLINADLTEAILCKAELQNVYFSRGVILTRADLTKAELHCGDLSYARLEQAKLMYAHLYGVKLIEANLSEANAFGAQCFDCDFTKVNLIGANLRKILWTSINFTQANLLGANFARGFFDRCDFSEAVLIADGTKYLTMFSGATFSHIRGWVEGEDKNLAISYLLSLIKNICYADVSPNKSLVRQILNRIIYGLERENISSESVKLGQYYGFEIFEIRLKELQQAIGNFLLEQFLEELNIKDFFYECLNLLKTKNVTNATSLKNLENYADNEKDKRNLEMLKVIFQCFHKVNPTHIFTLWVTELAPRMEILIQQLQLASWAEQNTTTDNEENNLVEEEDENSSLNKMSFGY